MQTMSVVYHSWEWAKAVESGWVTHTVDKGIAVMVWPRQ